MDFNSIVAFIKQYWYVFAIIILGFILINKLLKDKKRKIEYWNQIKENKERLEDELKWNNTEIKYILHNNKAYKVYGETWERSISFEESRPKELVKREQTKDELLNWNIKSMKDQILQYQNRMPLNAKIEDLKDEIKGNQIRPIEMHGFLVKRKYLDLVFFKIYLGKTESLYIERKDFWFIKNDVIRLNSQIRLMFRDGQLVKFGSQMIETTTERTERLMKDHTINAVGFQQKDFSRIDSHFAHQELMKDKDIEEEKEKKKAIAY